MLTTPCAWALFLNHFAINYQTYTLLTYLPKYLTEIQDFDMKSSGGIAALPYVLLFFCSVSAGQFADWLIRTHLSVRHTRILVQTITCIGSSLAMSLAGVMPTRDLAVASIMFSIIITGFSQVIACTAHRIAPPFDT